MRSEIEPLLPDAGAKMRQPKSSHAISIVRAVPTVAIVAFVALGVGAWSCLSTQLWVATDSGLYIKLAASLAEAFDLDHELHQFRLPGYPLLLALIFRLFGHSSPTAIMVIQQAMVAATIVLTALTAWTLWPRRAFVLVAGLLCALSPYLRGYAGTVLTEVPYAFVLSACVYFLVRHHRFGGRSSLAMASFAAGLCLLTKGIGQVMVVLCVCVAAHRAWCFNRQSGLTSARSLRRCTAAAALAVLPPMLLALPVMFNNYRTTGHFRMTCQGSQVLFYRAVKVERLHSPHSEALAKLRAALKQAKADGLLSPTVELREHYVINFAYRSVHGTSWFEAADVMNEAAMDLILDNKALILSHGVRHAYRSFIIPDPYYRVGLGVPQDELFDLEAARAQMSSLVGRETLDKYLPSPAQGPPASHFWSGWMRGHRRVVERGPSLTGVLDHPYEEFMWFCLLGGVASLAMPNRVTWLIPAMVIFLHIFISANLGGTIPRYAIPVHPFIFLFGAFACTGVVRACVTGFTFAAGLLARRLKLSWQGSILAGATDGRIQD